MAEYFPFKCAKTAFRTALFWGGCALLNAIALLGEVSVLNWICFVCLMVNLVGFEAACRAMDRGIE